MEIQRDFYLNQLIGLMGGDMVKVVTGIMHVGLIPFLLDSKILEDALHSH